MRVLASLIFACLGSFAHAELFLTPSLGAGYNSDQGTYYRIGLDAGDQLDENWSVGVGAYYASGTSTNPDREIGGGPFVGYAYPLLRVLIFQARQDVLYVDQRNSVPVGVDNQNNFIYATTSSYGLESSTYAGLSVYFLPNFGVSAGYRALLGLTNSNLGLNRSSPVLGLILGF